MTTARVLLVEDDPLLLRALSLLLQRDRYEVFPAADPRQALALVRKGCPIDVVLSDIVLPGMLGTQLVREITQISPQTPALLMTAGTIRLTDVPNGVPVLQKPLSRADLLSALASALSKSQTADPGMDGADGWDESRRLKDRKRVALARSREPEEALERPLTPNSRSAAQEVPKHLNAESISYRL